MCNILFLSLLSLTSQDLPNQPTNIIAKYVSTDTVSIQWTVPLIVYTQETYLVLYRSVPGNLNQTTGPVTGSADLSVIGGQFGVNLTGLVPSSLYYYTVVASNILGTTTTPVMNISFFPRTLLLAVGVVPCMRGVVQDEGYGCALGGWVHEKGVCFSVWLGVANGMIVQSVVITLYHILW